MSRKTAKYSDDATAVLYIRMPGWLRNAIATFVEERGETLNAWAANILFRAYREGQGLPPIPSPVGPIPTVQDILRSYLDGNAVLEPCGKEAPCERWSTEPTVVAGVGYCGHCGIRVS